MSECGVTVADQATRAAPPELRYVMNSALVMEQSTAQHVILLDMDTSRRTEITTQLYQLIRRFAAAGTASEVLGETCDSRLRVALDSLLARGLLQDADAAPPLPSRRRLSVAYRFCNAAAWNEKTKCDFVVLGAPYDMVGERECRLAPIHVRQKSLDYPYRLDVHSAQPVGWFDCASGRWILRGASMADAGDVPVDHAAAAVDAEAAVISVLDEVCASGAVPVVLGGDQASAEAVRTWCARNRDTAAVRIGAGENESDSAMHGPYESGWLHFDALNATGEPEAVNTRLQGMTTILLSIDAAVLHDCYVSGPTSTRELRMDVARQVIAAIGRKCRIVAIHLSGWTAGGAASDVTSAAACDLLLHAMDAALDTEHA